MTRGMTVLMCGVLGWGAFPQAGLKLAFNVAGQPAAQPAGQPTPRSAADFADADALLTALEKADEGLVTLTADLNYDVRAEVQGDRQVRKGKLYFDNRPPRKFAVLFKELWLGDERRREEQLIVFDGEWLVEKNMQDKAMIKRQVVPPGQKFDPLKIGEGPLPIPIGQKKSDVMLRFAAEIKPVEDGLAAEPEASPQEKTEVEAIKAHVAGATQVKLVPKPEFLRDTDFTEVRLWYRRNTDGDLLPVMARTLSKNLNTTVVQLSNVHVQKKGAAQDPAAEVPQELVRIDAPPPGWDFQQIPFRHHVEAEK